MIGREEDGAANVSAMATTTTTRADGERRLGGRFASALPVTMQAADAAVSAVAVDVSRHGLFVTCPRPPALQASLLVGVQLPSGPIETLATVVRRVEEQSRGPVGVGLKLFCLGAGAKDRWDRYVQSLESPGLVLPTRPLSPSAEWSASACFLVQPHDPAALLSFWNDHVVARRPLHVTPAVRQLGADVEFVLVHPHTHAEHVLAATVVEWNPDVPQRMGIRFTPASSLSRQAFAAFLGPMAAPPIPEVAAPELARLEREGANEYAFFSPKLAGRQEVVLHAADEVVVNREDLFDFHWTNPDDDDAG